VKYQRIEHDVDLLVLHREFPDRYPFILESRANCTASSRYSLLLAFPQKSLVLDQSFQLFLDGEPITGGFLSNFQQYWQQDANDEPLVNELPFAGGWFLYLGYELAQQVEPTLHLPASSEIQSPVAQATRIPAAIIIDHIKQSTWAVCEEEHSHRLSQMVADCHQCASSTLSDSIARLVTGIDEEAAEKFLQGVDRIKQYILEGDVFQVNLSRQWQGELQEDKHATDVYRQLRQANPAPFTGLAKLHNSTICSSSPERLVQINDQRIAVRPIAGTHPRAKQKEFDDKLAAALLAHPKEQSEHIMLIDLERNDLGRVCQPGTVMVNELMTLETYTHVHHIVSNVEGNLQPEATIADVIKAVFPGGTITGCPKIRCMEIIAELEQTARGAYTGAMGYVNHNGGLDLNILIRSIVVEGQKFTFRAGAGIVADSVPEKELAETRAKAKGMLRGLGVELD
jgi:anthranilate synthase component I